MTVINPNSISGITSITMPSGGDNVLTVHTNDGVERFRIDSSGNVKVGSAATISQDGDVFFTGVTTATTFTGAHSGSGANLTSLPAAQLTGALPAISGANLTGIAATDNVRTGILDVAGISTFRNTVNIGAAVTISESGIEASGIGITVANINSGQIGGRRNIIINGAMKISQRATSSTSTSGGYTTVDRIRTAVGGHDEAPTFEQADVTSGGAYDSGFRKCLKVTNGNQTSGAGSGDYIQCDYYIEAQDVANSGWDYTNPNSFLTLSFWMKASVSQFYTFAVRAPDSSTEQVINFKTPVLTANTWTKIEKTIPGNSNLGMNNDTGLGLQIMFFPFIGTSYSTVGLAEGTWSDWASAKHAIPNTSTWWTTNDATWELTGIQLEVGTQATPFEHLSFAEDFALCQRYYWTIPTTIYGCAYGGASGFCHYALPVQMRATGTLTYSNIRTSTGFYNYSTNQIMQVQMGNTTPYISSPKIDAEL